MLTRTDGYVCPTEQRDTTNQPPRLFQSGPLTDNDLVGATIASNQAAATGYFYASTQGFARPAAP